MPSDYMQITAAIARRLVMLLIRQAGLQDCGIAVAAMLARVPYGSVLDRLVIGLSAERALSELTMWRVLEDVTQAEWQLSELGPPWPRVGSYQFPDLPIAVLIKRRCSSGHYIAVRGQQVYDPLFETPFTQTEYPDRDACIAALFTPKAEFQHYAG